MTLLNKVIIIIHMQESQELCIAFVISTIDSLLI